ncbi:Transitional endoplasmic reticulum ATPase TER94 [Chamberlinius hualienensis]
MAGPGHKLTESTKSNAASAASSSTAQPRARPSHGAMMSGVAAIERIEKFQQNQPSMVNRSSKVIKAEARKALEEEEKLKSAYAGLKEVNIEASSHLTVTGVYFRCPLVGPYVLPKSEMDAKIKEFLYDQLNEERGLTATLIIHTCNKDKALVQACIETLKKCLSNIIESPCEEKFRKIRVNTKTFMEKIQPVEGAVDFLIAAGFQLQKLPHNEGPEEDFYVMSADSVGDLEDLETLRDALESAEPIKPELDRGIQILQPTAILERIELPSEFYTISKEEIKREQQLKSEAVEQMSILKTKAMRDREAERELRRYRYCLIRVRFPDDIILQGTFKAWEKLFDLKEFIRENLAEEISFSLISPNGHRLMEGDDTLAELGLAPAALVNFSVSDEGASSQSYLKPETMALLQTS